ncbi:hypothetical protein NDU88_006353 [Pleurodeles waltl]|uniref:Uncharacterized protein n=1 Tax=Pleurodeles waltl TaxID=8319 RepID=A0AAV7PLJ4_PLEWA|nr:hypothetical protein NDU88_006353 [Pleurodeles waltl]
MGLLAELQRRAQLASGPQGEARPARAGGLVLLRVPVGHFLAPAGVGSTVSAAGWALSGLVGPCPPRSAAPPAANSRVQPCCEGRTRDGRAYPASGEAVELHGLGSAGGGRLGSAASGVRRPRSWWRRGLLCSGRAGLPWAS